MRKWNERRNKKQAGTKATVLLSGGIDSATCLAYYLNEGFRVDALFVDYGQIGAPKELRAAKAICRHFRIRLRVVALSGTTPKGPGLVLGRNAFLLFSAVLEFQTDAGFIVIGIHSGTRYGDCSSLFVKRMQGVLDTYAGGSLQIGVPFLTWRKRDIWNYPKVCAFRSL